MGVFWFLRQGLSLNLKLASEAKGSSYICVPSTRVPGLCYHIQLYVGSDDSNSSPCAWTISILLAELTLNPNLLTF